MAHDAKFWAAKLPQELRPRFWALIKQHPYGNAAGEDVYFWILKRRD